MNEQEKHAASQEERKEKIRARYKGVDRSELEFIPAKQKEKLFEDAGTKRVCAYCRVSTDDANQTSSYELQKNHYEDMIKEHAGWTLVGIYADEGISGTSLQHRDEFNRMIEDCKAGKIDLIVTKSVSRFARNIVDCIAKVRELANTKLQVGVFFETEHIYTLDNTSEMMLAVLSAAAQEESHTKSEIMNISIEQRFSRGIFLTPKLLGYDKDEDGNLVINESEADTVRLCYYLFLSGFPTSEIAEILMDLGRKTKLGNTKWTGSTVVNVLRNERHCGDVLSRKTFTPNYLDHKSKKNNHDRNQYRQTDHHEAIVSREIYNAAQKMLDAGKYMKIYLGESSEKNNSSKIIIVGNKTEPNTSIGTKGKINSITITTKDSVENNRQKINTKGKISNINVDVQKDGSVIVDENNNTRVFYDPIYILDGKKISKDKFKNLDADKIKSITVLKGEDAIKSYGKDGENGALIIQTKGNTATSTDPIKTITITKKDTSEDIMKNTFCIVDGKKISETELKNIDPNNIQSITVLKDEKSKEEYGATDKDCVIWITLKK